MSRPLIVPAVAFALALPACIINTSSDDEAESSTSNADTTTTNTTPPTTTTVSDTTVTDTTVDTTIADSTDTSATDDSTGDTAGDVSPGLVYVAFRNLEGGDDGILLVDLDPQSPAFGTIIQRVDIGTGVLPHHLYWNRDHTRLYATALGGERLYEIHLTAGEMPGIDNIEALDVGDNVVAEDIYFTEDGSRFYVTFMGGQGAAVDGSVGVFDATTNALTNTILAPMGAPNDPFVIWPHGISASEEMGFLVVTQTVAPDMSGAGNTITTIDLATDTPIETFLVSTADDVFNVPVEVLALREGLDPYMLVTTLGTGDIWIAPYDMDGPGEFTQAVVGADTEIGSALEMYVRENSKGVRELFVSFGTPGLVNVYGLDMLPELPLLRTLDAAAGSHHIVFFESSDGTELAVIENNLLNLDGLNAGTLTIRDVNDNTLAGEIDLPTSDGLMVESIESAFGTGYLLHH
ncbi:MAG TPA: hypothetical protein VG755_35915 [Nannocystaceae bacterium]|nr:hypothetical protein [Nannocystaceae bacterium]